MSIPNNLQAGDVYIALSRCSAISLETARQYRAVLSDTELARNQRYRFERDRHRDLIARALLRSSLSRLLGVAPEALEFTIDDKGKPHLAPQYQAHAPSFNLSHSGDWVILAIARETIGVDVENTTRNNDVLAIADRYFFGDEYRELMSFDATEQAQRFFDYWTLKEAYMKARGEGISLGLANFGFSIRSAIRLQLTDAVDDKPEEWQFYCLSPEADYRLALALKSRARPRIQVEEVVPMASENPLCWEFQ